MQVNVGMLNMTKSWLCNTRHMRGVHASTLIISDSAAYPQPVSYTHLTLPTILLV